MRVTSGQREYGYGKCSRCSNVVELGNFRQWKWEGVEHRSRQCKLCEGGRGWVVTLEQRKIARSNGRGAGYYHKQNLIQSAKMKPCADCGQSFPPMCMEFDHLPEHKKEYNIGSMMNNRLELIVAEIAKCEIVCACCHRIRSATRGWSGGRKPKPSAVDT